VTALPLAFQGEDPGGQGIDYRLIANFVGAVFGIRG
jgi:hypothetical protein